MGKIFDYIPGFLKDAAGYMADHTPDVVKGLVNGVVDKTAPYCQTAASKVTPYFQQYAPTIVQETVAMINGFIFGNVVEDATSLGESSSLMEENVAFYQRRLFQLGVAVITLGGLLAYRYPKKAKECAHNLYERAQRVTESSRAQLAKLPYLGFLHRVQTPPKHVLVRSKWDEFDIKELPSTPHLLKEGRLDEINRVNGNNFSMSFDSFGRFGITFDIEKIGSIEKARNLMKLLAAEYKDEPVKYIILKNLKGQRADCFVNEIRNFSKVTHVGFSLCNNFHLNHVRRLIQVLKLSEINFMDSQVEEAITSGLSDLRVEVIDTNKKGLSLAETQLRENIAGFVYENMLQKCIQELSSCDEQRLKLEAEFEKLETFSRLVSEAPIVESPSAQALDQTEEPQEHEIAEQREDSIAEENEIQDAAADISTSFYEVRDILGFEEAVYDDVKDQITKRLEEKIRQLETEIEELRAKNIQLVELQVALEEEERDPTDILEKSKPVVSILYPEDRLTIEEQSQLEGIMAQSSIVDGKVPFTMDLSNLPITDAMQHLIVNHLEVVRSQVSSLILDNTLITGMHIQHIGNTFVRSLSLRNCSLLQSDLLQKLPRELLYLDLSGNTITSRALLSGISNIEKLHTLRLENIENLPYSNFVLTLRAIFPSLQVLSIVGSNIVAEKDVTVKGPSSEPGIDGIEIPCSKGDEIPIDAFAYKMIKLAELDVKKPFALVTKHEERHICSITAPRIHSTPRFYERIGVLEPISEVAYYNTVLGRGHTFGVGSLSTVEEVRLENVRKGQCTILHEDSLHFTGSAPLRRIGIGNTNIEISGMQPRQMVDGVMRGPTCETLTVKGRGLSKAVLNFIKQFEEIRTLNISGCQLRIESARHPENNSDAWPEIQDIVKKQQIRELNVANTDLNYDDLISIEDTGSGEVRKYSEEMLQMLSAGLERVHVSGIGSSDDYKNVIGNFGQDRFMNFVFAEEEITNNSLYFGVQEVESVDSIEEEEGDDQQDLVEETQPPQDE